MFHKSAYELVLLEIMAEMDERNIRTLADLQSPGNAGIYTALWMAVYDYVACDALTRNGSWGADGKWKMGNKEKVCEQKKLGMDPKDLCGDISLKIMENIANVMVRPLEARIAYCKGICNYGLVDAWRSICGGKIESLDEPVGEDAFVRLGSVSNGISAEDWVMAFETVRQKESSRAQGVLEDLGKLHSFDQQFVYLCSYDRMCPRHIYETVERLAAQGRTPQEIPAVMMERLCRKYAISRSETVLQLSKPLSRSMVKHLSTLDRQVITNKISDVKLTMPASVKQHLKERQKAGGMQR